MVSSGTNTPRVFRELAPAINRMPHDREHTSFDLNVLCKPTLPGEIVLDLRLRRIVPQCYPDSFTQASAEDRLVFGKRKAGGRPPSDKTAKRRKTDNGSSSNSTPKPTRLRKDKPVSASLNVDVWHLIFEWTDPATLFKLGDATPWFKHITGQQTVWRKSRISTYGHDMPDPPAGLTEQQYCELVCGLGCHACGSQNVRKVYWAFLKRWCNECYRKLTVREREAKQVLEYSQDFLQCVMSATRDSWGHYIGAGTVRTTTGLGDGRVPCYLRSDVEKLKTDYEQMMAEETPEMMVEEKLKRRQDWVTQRIEDLQVNLDHIRKIEEWQKSKDKAKLVTYSGHRAEREKFFKDKGMAHVPQITAERLLMSKAYQRAIKIPRAPTERCWDHLLPKLLDGH